ncbi:hypothetical protein AB0M28_21875 [Streptomyces sp. NPDC051940]|uniref:hypothetical protein n=1 Tax=Streptomyces sp. NPDC051940 TaxID=3155675 RepID=UPI003428A575
MSSNRVDLAKTALRWIEQEELHGYDPELFTDILSKLASLASTANREGHNLHCWMC